MELTGSGRDLVTATCKSFKGSERRVFMARVAEQVGGQRAAAREFHWGRDTIRLGQHELRSGVRCVDAFNARGRKPIEFHLPELLPDMRDIIESFSQTDPRFESNRRYCRLTVSQIVVLLIDEKGYEDTELPSNECLRLKVHQLGFTLHKVQKVKPKKKSR